MARRRDRAEVSMPVETSSTAIVSGGFLMKNVELRPRGFRLTKTCSDCEKSPGREPVKAIQISLGATFFRRPCPLDRGSMYDSPTGSRRFRRNFTDSSGSLAGLSVVRSS
jgi:hypothetical protein